MTASERMHYAKQRAGWQLIARQATVAVARQYLCPLPTRPLVVDKIQANGGSWEDDDWTAKSGKGALTSPPATSERTSAYATSAPESGQAVIHQDHVFWLSSNGEPMWLTKCTRSHRPQACKNGAWTADFCGFGLGLEVHRAAHKKYAGEAGGNACKSGSQRRLPPGQGTRATHRFDAVKSGRGWRIAFSTLCS